MTTAIEKISKARQLLVEARTIQDVKDILDSSKAAKVYAEQKRLSEETKQYCHEIYTRAQIKLGEMLAQMEKNKGMKGSVVTGKEQRPVKDESPTLKDLGLTKDQSSVAQMLAELPEQEQEKIIHGTKTITQAKRERTKENKIKEVKLPSDKYRVIYADPPWFYGNSGQDEYGHAERHYPSMKISEICSMPIESMCEDNAVLFMWVTSPLLEECFDVINAWGFKYKSSFVWDKIKHNFGHYNSVRHELLLVCTRGSCTPDVGDKIDSVQSIEKSRVHSEKPETFRTIIDILYPHGKRIELFARKKIDGWDNYGNEII